MIVALGCEGVMHLLYCLNEYIKNLGWATQARTDSERGSSLNLYS